MILRNYEVVWITKWGTEQVSKHFTFCGAKRKADWCCAYVQKIEPNSPLGYRFLPRRYEP